MPSPAPRDVVVEFPPQVLLLAEALAPLARNTRQAMSRHVRPSGHEFMLLDDLVRHADTIHRALTHLSGLPDRFMEDVILKEDAGPLDAGRAAGRLEQVLTEFVDGYHDVRSSHASPDSSQARRLIMGVYRHHITTLCNWLEQLAKVIADPASAVRLRDVEANSHVQLTVALNMTSPPEMAELGALARRLQREAESPRDSVEAEPRAEACQPQAKRPGLLDKIAALVFGLGISQAMLGRRDE
jgi:hypothetical protein